MAEPRDIKLAKRLARLVVEAGEPGVSQLRPALERILKGRSAADQRAFLKIFHKAVVRELQKDTLTIESAEVLPEAVVEELTAAFAGRHERSLHVARQINPDLIAGIRIRLGDSVYDASLLNHLQSLASRIH